MHLTTYAMHIIFSCLLIKYKKSNALFLSLAFSRVEIKYEWYITVNITISAQQ